jgi:hypothetical protein
MICPGATPCGQYFDLWYADVPIASWLLQNKKSKTFSPACQGNLAIGMVPFKMALIYFK